MPIKQVTTPLVVTDGIEDKTVRIYHADQSGVTPGEPRVQISGTYDNGQQYTFDHALSELNLTDEQTAMVLGAVQAACTGVFTLEGFEGS